jgi:hypothetical protein
VCEIKRKPAATRNVKIRSRSMTDRLGILQNQLINELRLPTGFDLYQLSISALPNRGAVWAGGNLPPTAPSP